MYHDRFRQFFTRVESLYHCDRPLHISRPAESIIKSFSYVEWTALTPVQMQLEQRARNIVVRGWPVKNKILFNEDGIRKVAGTPSRQISVNGKDISQLLHIPIIYCQISKQTIRSSLLEVVVGRLL